MNGVQIYPGKVFTKRKGKNNEEVYIYDWSEISQKLGRTLILGNGASIAVSSKFNYHFLKDCAITINKSKYDIKSLFEQFNTTDFELLLRLVWQSYRVNQILGIENETVQHAYLQIRDSLIQAVRHVHPSYQEVSPFLPKIAKFMRNFDYIISLNYDLIVYWAMMHANNDNCLPQFKDYFLDRKTFSDKWKDIGHRKKASLVFYPHGNLMLAQDIFGNEFKISSGESLLDEILLKWETEDCIPLFISEGTSIQKISSITKSPYLNTVYKEVLINKLPVPRFYLMNRNEENFMYLDNKEKYGPEYKIPVIYGWSIGEQDKHILSQLVKYKFYEKLMNRASINVAISVYNNDQKYCKDVIEIFESLDSFREGINIYFFDSASEGCWNN